MRKLLIISFFFFFASVNAQFFSGDNEEQPTEEKGLFNSARAGENPTDPPVDDDPPEPLPIGDYQYALLAGAVILGLGYRKQINKKINA